jgi:hypothetical protein
VLTEAAGASGLSRNTERAPEEREGCAPWGRACSAIEAAGPVVEPSRVGMSTY